MGPSTPGHLSEVTLALILPSLHSHQLNCLQGWAELWQHSEAVESGMPA